LSENAVFAKACLDADIVFVGPPVAAIESMGSKIQAKQLMEAAGVPILPGYHGSQQGLVELADEARSVGFPLLIKASAGGGGKGMRLVESADEFEKQLAGAQREALAAFGEDAVLLERYLTAPKHIEVQVMADTHGNVVHLFERDCSVQRRHQKVIEEAPAPTVDSELRAQIGAAAVAAAKQVGYVGAGTIEFIAEDGEFYFMEMNTRLQVEHPVTEAISGLDLVELQLRVAAGERLGFDQEDLVIRGHAVEVRLYAENPSNRFLPSTGTLECFDLPDSVRIDAGVQMGDRVSMHYDPMLAKLIAHDVDRDAAINQLIGALTHSRVAGVEHNIGYLREILNTEEFRAGDYTTALADLVHDAVLPQQKDEFAVLAALGRFAEESDSADSTTGAPWTRKDGFRLNLGQHRTLRLRQGKQEFVLRVDDDEVLVNDKAYVIREVNSMNASRVSARIAGDLMFATILRRGHTVYVMAGGHTEKFIDLTDDASRYQKQTLTGTGIVAPMPGHVIAVNVVEGDKVKAGDVVVIVEAMKMEHSVVATHSGVVKKVCCAVTDKVEEGIELVEIQ
jgi:3-methylcrotonyl-CoA carboxylase alpha subunit